jgi:uroporphyrinogen-III decarboxylase
MMTSRQRILATLRHQEPDRYSWAPLLDPYFMQGLPAEVSAAGIPAFLRSIGADIFLRHCPFCDVTLEDVTVTEAREDDRITRTLTTPLGPISETSLHIAGAETDFITDHLIKGPEDYEKVLYIITHQRLTPRYEQTQQTVDELGEDGVVQINAGSPPLTAFFRYLPQERVIFEFHDHPERLDRLAASHHEHQLELCRLAAAAPAEVVIAYSADITTRLISPRMFERYALPYLQEYARILHAAGKLFIIHTCGDVRALLPMMRESGIDGIDSLSEPPLGNTPFEVAMEVLGDRVCLIGGVSPVVLANGSPDELRGHVLDLFRRVPHRRNLLLCTSDATAYGTPVENLRLVADLVKTYC